MNNIYYIIICYLFYKQNLKYIIINNNYLHNDFSLIFIILKYVVKIIGYIYLSVLYYHIIAAQL